MFLAKVLLIQWLCVQTGLHRFLFALLGLVGGLLLRADPATFPTAAANQPVAANLPKDVLTVALVTPAPPKQCPRPADEVMPSAMVFHNVPEGLVAHIISVRLGRKVEVEANATQPITGNFGQMNLVQALNEAAAKASLVVIDEGPEGLHLVPRESSLGKVKPGSVPSVLSVAVTPTGKSAADLAAEKRRDAVLKAADEKRIELLKLRAKLLLQEPDQ